MVNKNNLNSQLKLLIEMKNIQGSDGNWNSSPYMKGMYDAMIDCCNIVFRTKFKKLKKPKKWYKIDESKLIKAETKFYEENTQISTTKTSKN